MQAGEAYLLHGWWLPFDQLCTLPSLLATQRDGQHLGPMVV